MNTHIILTCSGLLVRCRLSAAFLSVVCFLMVTGCQRAEELGPVAEPASVAEIRQAFSSGADALASDGAAIATGTGWATLRGQFVYDGTPPQMKPYDVRGEDRAKCSRAGKAPLQETLLVDPETMGIANVVIFIRDAARVHESAQPNDESIVFDQKECVFLTHVAAMTVGQTLEIKNSDPMGHNTKIEGRKNVFNQSVPANETLVFSPQKEEPVPVSVACSIHPWMAAYFLPRANGYHAVTGADGSFEIANVPAGEVLEFQVWHESVGARDGGPLVLETPEAKSLKWSRKGRFKIRLEENEEKVLNLTVPASALGG
ncbi:MAG: hypothetical protein MK171_08785 [Pirellulales bacterium]|nr:hypothetical protein [Pirellulales bacterium]